MWQDVLLAWALALLALASALVLVALYQRYQRARVRATFRSRLRKELERDKAIHDKLAQMPLPEEADDYLSAIHPVYDSEAPTHGPWKHVHRVSPTRVITSRGIGQGSAETGIRSHYVMDI
jgi:hypothetical protein